MRKIFVRVSLVIMLSACGIVLIAIAGQEELLEGPHKVEFRNDFNGDGIADVITINWKIVRDYAINIFDKPSSQKFIWYQANFRINSPKGKVYHDDTFSMKEDDFHTMLSLIGKENMSPQFYFDNFFNIPKFGSTLNEIVSRPISQEELDMEYLGKLIKSENVNTTPEAVAAELTKNNHIVVLYRRDWHEDLGIIAYSKLLDRAVYLVSPFDR